MLDAVRLVVGTGGRPRRGARRERPRVGRCRSRDGAVGSDPLPGGASRAVADRTSIALIGTYEASCTLTALTPLEQAGLALVSPVDTAPALVDAPEAGRRVLVRLAPADTLQGAAAADEAQALGLQRLFVLTGRSGRARAPSSPRSPPRRRRRRRDRRPRHGAGHGRAGRNAVLARCRAAHADAIWFGGGRGPGAVALLRGDRGRRSAPARARPAGRDRDRRALPRRRGARGGRGGRGPARHLAVRAARRARRCGRRLRGRVRRAASARPGRTPRTRPTPRGSCWRRCAARTARARACCARSSARAPTTA